MTGLLFTTQHFDSVATLPAAWEPVFARMAEKSPFLSRAWFALFEQQVPARGDKLFYVAVEMMGRPQLLLPLWMQPDRHLPRYSRVLKSLANFYSCLFEPLLAEDAIDPTAAFDAAIRHILRAAPAFDVLLFQPLDPIATSFTQLTQALQRAGLMVTALPVAANWFEPLDGRDFDTYFNGLSKKMRGTIRRQEKKFAEQFQVQFRLFADETDLPRGIADYEQVYAKSWKGSESYPAFMPAFIRMLAQQGWLRLGILYADGQPVAAQLWIVAGGVAYIYKMSYDQDYTDHGVGNNLAVRMWRHVIDTDQVQTVDYLSGDEPYKKLWMEQRRERWVIEAVRPWSWRGRAMLLRRRVKTIVKAGIELSGQQQSA